MRTSYSHHGPGFEAWDRSLRASDRDRDRVVDVLREQHLAGRLESDEFQERLDRCYAAKTYGELDELIADLPREEATRRATRVWRWPVAALLIPLVVAIVLSHGRLLWLVIPLFFFAGRPLIWAATGRRVGWGFMGCGFRRTASPGRYV